MGTQCAAVTVEISSRRPTNTDIQMKFKAIAFAMGAALSVSASAQDKIVVKGSDTLGAKIIRVSVSRIGFAPYGRVTFSCLPKRK